MDILIGTKNEYKATEMVYLLGKHKELEVHFLKDINLEIKIKEDQLTLMKNAEKKAVEISKLTDWYILTSDGGVDIPGLGDKWDIMKNQRTVGEDKTDIEKAEKLLEFMKGLKGKDRKASYRFGVALAKKGRVIWSSEQITDWGYISNKLYNNKIPPYRWMSHLWYYPQYKKVFNQLNESEKVEIRKRGKGIQRELRNVIKVMISAGKS